MHAEMWRHLLTEPHTRHNKSAALVAAYVDWPVLTRHRLRVEFGLHRAVAAEIFACTLLLSDDFVALTPPDWVILNVGIAASQCSRRFLSLAMRLPLELQMVLAWRCVGGSRDIVLSEDFEPAIIAITT